MRRIHFCFFNRCARAIEAAARRGLLASAVRVVPSVWESAALLAVGASAAAGPVHVDVMDEAGKPLADAVVFLDSPQAQRLAKPLQGAAMAQEKKRFVPSVMVVPVGTEVAFPNRDAVRHHVYSFSPAKSFELKLYSGSPANPVLFDRPGVVSLGCNIHDAMVASIVVVETPYFGVSGGGAGASAGAAPGVVEWGQVPPGEYTLRTWHARLAVGAPAQPQVVQVPTSGALKLVVRLQGLQP